MNQTVEERVGTIPTAHPEIYLGVDFGYAQNHTALAGLRRTQHWKYVQDGFLTRPVRTKEDVFHLFTLKQWPLRTEFDDIIADINDLVAKLKRQGGSNKAPHITLAGDQTGVGSSVMRDFKYKHNPHNIEIKAVNLNGGATERYDKETNIHHVPRLDLLMTGVRGIDSTLGQDEQQARVKFALKLAASPTAQTLNKELRNVDFRVYRTKDHPDAPAWRVQEHDDICFAFSLACWAADKGIQFPMMVHGLDIFGGSATNMNEAVGKALRKHGLDHFKISDFG